MAAAILNCVRLNFVCSCVFRVGLHTFHREQPKVFKTEGFDGKSMACIARGRCESKQIRKIASEAMLAMRTAEYDRQNFLFSSQKGLEEASLHCEALAS